MKNILKRVLLLLLFWLLLFFIYRLLFYFGILALLKDVPFSLILQSFYKSFRLDLSMVGYLITLPIVFLFFFTLFRKKIIIYIFDGLNYLFIIIYSFTAIGEMCLYREWKSKLNTQALAHFAHPSEVFKSASTGLTLLFFSLSVIGCFVFIRIYNRKISLKNDHPIDSVSILGSLSFLVIGTAFSFIIIRGGFQQIPIQDSDAFFCNQPIVNDATVNSLWHIVFNTFEYEEHFKENPYTFFKMEEANEIVKGLYKIEKDTTISFLKTTRPNIVFIILEGWSAYEIKSFGGDDFAPFMDSLSHQGIRFTKIYPAGYVSDQGIPSILSSFPSAPQISIISQSSKSAKLPCINEDLKTHGYQSAFIFGGDLTYGNIKSYVYNKKFDVIKGEPDINQSLPRGELGIQDGDMEKEYLQLLNKAQPPFVYTWFTLSSHSPYDFPGEKKALTSYENDYVNGVSYADKSLQHFFTEAKKQSWYKNTLFVVVSDHSHGCQKQFNLYNPEYHRIPLLFFGEVIDSSFKGKEITSVFSQLDITKTLLKQMKLDDEAEKYEWGKNMFNPYTKPFSYFCNNTGAGFVNNLGYISYQHNLKTLAFSSLGDKNPETDSLAKYGHAFLQSAFEVYRSK